MSLPTVLSVDPLSTHSMFHIERVQLRFSNGEERAFERFIKGHRLAVMIIPFLDEDTVLLVREYGAGIENYHLGLPKGGIERSETVEEASNRELMEEVGYGAKSLKILKTFTAAPNYSSNQMHLVLAEDLYPASLPGDEPEPIEVVPWSLRNLDVLFARDDVHEARSIAALMWIARQKGVW